MRPKSLVWAILVVGVAFAIEHSIADFDGLIDIDGDSDDRVAEKFERKSGESSNGKGDDEDDYTSGVMSDESGSGSGEEDSVVDVSVVSPTTKKPTATTEETTTINNEITERTEEPTEGEMSEEPTDGNEAGDDNMLGGGISETDAPDDDSPGAEAKAKARIDEKTVLSVLTTEVIAAVVVGAVCAVILIAFLVYRLRKRDEGSYALSDAGYKDTYKLQGDTGKEAFV